MEGNHRLPKCKPNVVYIRTSLVKNGGADNMSLATNLVALRKQSGLTQMDLAEKLNVSRQAVSRWEVGAAVPSTDNLKILSDLYGVSVDELLKGEMTGMTQNTDLPDSYLEVQNSNGKNKKSQIVFSCVLIFMILVVMIAAGIVKCQGERENQNLPMGNMSVEEDDDLVETFSFE